MSENSLSKSGRRARIYAYAPLFLWIAVIFFLSSSLGASASTSRFILPLLEWLFPGASAETITLYHSRIRKIAHFTEYAILAFWAWRAFSGGNARFSKAKMDASRFVERYWYGFSVLIVVLIASIDEFNQSFNAARTGSVYDILLDVSGGIFMILGIGILRKSSHRQTQENTKPD
jgi:VanZ family protein